MKNKGLLLIAGGIAIAAAIIAWLMFGGEAPKNPENTASNAVSAVVKNTTVSREQDGRRLWEFSVEALESISGSGEAVMKGVKGKIYREDGGVKATLSTGGEITAEEISWNQKDDIITATGKVKVVKDEHTALADKIVTSSKFDHFKLSGHAEVQKGEL